MPYLGQRPSKGDENNFKILDNISSYTLTFDGSDAAVVSAANDTITSLNHRFVQGQRVTYNKGGGTVITGLSDGVYYIIKHDHHNIKLATSASNATNGVAVNITGVGAGSSHTLNVAFDGVNTKFKATHTNGQKAKITRSAQLVISMNGVIQQPHDSATPSTGFGFDLDGTIVFSQAPVSTDVYWAHVLTNNNVTFDISDNDVDNFTGNGSTVSFNLSKTPPDNRNVLVTIDGVVQYPNDPDGTVRAYTVVENVLTFTTAPAAGAEIQVRHIGFAGSTSGGGGSGVTNFYGRTGSVVLKNTDNIVANNAEFAGNLTVNGTMTTLDTKLTEVDQLEVAANNTTVGVAITQSGSGDILKLYDGSSEVFSVATQGDGIGAITISSPKPRIVFTETNATPDYQIRMNGGIFSIHDSTNNIGRISITSSRTDINNPVLLNNDTVWIGDKLVHWTDDDTAIRFPAANTVTVETGGNERFRIASDGQNTIKSGAHDKGLDILPVGNSQETRLRIQAKNSSGTEHTFSFNAKQSANRMDISGTGPICFIGSQNVGVHNSIPTSPLHVGDDVNPHSTKALLFVGPASGDGQFHLRGGSPTVFFDSTSSGNAKILTDNAALTISNGTLDSNGTELLRITSGGQIGIGNITPDTWSTGHGLTIGTSQATLWGVGDQVNLSGNAYFNNGWKAAATKAGASQIEQALGNIDFKVSGSVTADNSIAWIDALRILSNGNVGIATDTAPHKLSVKGTISMISGGSATQIVNISQDGSNNGYIAVNDASGTTRARLDSSGVSYVRGGNFGVGTNSPSSIIHATGSDSSIGYQFINTHSTTGFGVKIKGGGTSDDRYSLRVDNAADDELFRVNANGRVGIGTYIPGVLVDVQHHEGSGGQSIIRNKATQANASTFVRAESSDNKYIGLLKYGTGHSAYGALAAGGGAVYANSSVPITIMSDGGYINFATGGNSEKVRITPSGYLHLGNTGHGTNKVGGQAVTGEDFDPIFKIYNSVASKWLMHLRSDTATGSNGIFMRAGNNSNNYSMYITARDEHVKHFIVRGDGNVGIGTDVMDSSANLSITDTGSARIYMKSGNSADCSLIFGALDDAATGAIRYDHSDDSFRLYGYNNAEALRIDNNGNVSIGNNPTVHADTIFHIEDSGETNVKIEGSTSTLGARISLQNNDTTANSYSQYAFNDAGGQSTCAIQGINTDQTNNHGELAFLTRNAQGTPPEERLRIKSDGQINFLHDAVFQNSSWTGNKAGKIQRHNNILYIQGGTTGIYLRNSAGNAETLITDTKVKLTGNHTTLEVEGGRATNADAMVLHVNDNYHRKLQFAEATDAYAVGQYGGFIGYDAANNYTTIGTNNAGTAYIGITLDRNSSKVKLYYAGNQKLQTHTDGVGISGYITASYFKSSGPGGGEGIRLQGLAAGSGNNAVDTGISVNQGNASATMLVIGSRNTSDQQHVQGYAWLLRFAYNGNHLPAVHGITGNSDFWSISKSSSNTLQINGNSGNWQFGGIWVT